MSDIKKIELALSDLTTALAEHAEKHAADIGSERIESWHNLFKNIAQRVEKLEAAALSENVQSRIDSWDNVFQDLGARLQSRMADLESRIDELVETQVEEKKTNNRRVQVLQNERRQLQNEITAAHRRLDELKYSDLGRITELEKRIDDLENDGLDNVRTIVADMINDGDIRLHVD